MAPSERFYQVAAVDSCFITRVHVISSILKIICFLEHGGSTAANSYYAQPSQASAAPDSGLAVAGAYRGGVGLDSNSAAAMYTLQYSTLRTSCGPVALSSGPIAPGSSGASVEPLLSCPGPTISGIPNMTRTSNTGHVPFASDAPLPAAVTAASSDQLPITDNNNYFPDPLVPDQNLYNDVRLKKLAATDRQAPSSRREDEKALRRLKEDLSSMYRRESKCARATSDSATQKKLSKSQFESLKALKNKPEVVVKPSDKGKGFVVTSSMSAENYEAKVNERAWKLRALRYAFLP